MAKRAKLTLGKKPVEGPDQAKPKGEKQHRASALKKDAPKKKTALSPTATPPKPKKTESTIGKTLLAG